MSHELPEYIRSSATNPESARGAWYKNTAPSYAGIFLWVAFYMGLAEPNGMIAPLREAGPAVCLLALGVAGLLCFAFYYYAPAMLGMRAGKPLYVVATSTFGAQGGYVMPGLMMGLLQVGWYAVATSVSAGFVLRGFHQDPQQARGLFTLVALLWAYGLAWLAMRGIGYVARAAQFLNWVPLAMILLVFWANRGGLSSYPAPAPGHALSGFLTVLTVVTGYFGTAGAAGADFGMSARHKKDVVLGGLGGIALAIVVAGGLPLLSVAGHMGLSGSSDTSYVSAIGSAGGLAHAMFLIFALASLAPTCFCCFVISTCFGTMLPRVPKAVSTLVGITIAALLAVTGLADNLVGFFGIVGASFGPICGAMAAEYWLSRGKFAGPRRGINWPGFAAWGLGFVVGVLDKLPGVPSAWVALDRPAPLWSFVVGFVVYAGLSKLGLRSQVWPSSDESAAVSERGVPVAGAAAEA
jgi:cytosine permease